MSAKSSMTDERRIRTQKNTARYFVENPGVAWVALAATIAWGVYGIIQMPKRKDPDIPIPTAAAVCVWPGMSAEEIEQQITTKIEEKLAENADIERIESIVRTNVNVTLVKVRDDVEDPERVFDDLKDRLDLISDLPSGAGPISFLKNFGDTATLMLTVASPMNGFMQKDGRLVGAEKPRYSYHELDSYTETLEKMLKVSPKVGKVARYGVLPEAVTLTYSPERLTQAGISMNSVKNALLARNIALPGGIVEADGRNVVLMPSGAFRNESDLGDTVIGGTAEKPLRLRDVFEIRRDYQDPPRFLNFTNFQDKARRVHRAPSITLAVYMRNGEQIADFSAEVDAVLQSAKKLLPQDLIFARTSDQAVQVKESLGLFMQSLLEAVVLVVAVAFIGFRKKRFAVLIAVSIPLTIAMTFGMMLVLGIDIQQTSVASLILALGLLVDDPVVAQDAIGREISQGRPARIAAWLGPTKLAHAIVFATIANIAAYLPLLFAVDGSVGRFIYSLPIVMTCALVASRIVSMTFVPLLGAQLLEKLSTDEKGGDSNPLSNFYRRVISKAVLHRKAILLIALAALLASIPVLKKLKTAFFPKDLSYFFYVDIWTPEDASFEATSLAAAEAERIVREVADDFGQKNLDENGRAKEVISAMTSFVGGSGPRFWFSMNPELQQLNYAQIVVRTSNKYDTRSLVQELQQTLKRKMVGAKADVRELETGKPVGVPVAFRFSGNDFDELRNIAKRAESILRSIPTAERVRDDWGASTLAAAIQVDPSRAALSGLTHADAALSSIAASSGRTLTDIRDGERDIPVVLKLDRANRPGLSLLGDMVLFSEQNRNGIAQSQVASINLRFQEEKIRRRNHFRTVTVSAFPAQGVRASEVFAAAKPRFEELERSLPPGYRMEVGGEKEAQKKGFGQVSVAMGMSLLLIYFVLVLEFKSAVKPLLVFAAVPFGIVGAALSLVAANTPFGFMAFLGIVSLIGVIVSHIIVLFDFIENAREDGVSLEEALIEAGIVRFRPVMITVGATVLGLIPLAVHGGPLWEPLCYAQIGGLTAAAVITLLLTPVLYAWFVLDIRIVKWKA